MKLGWKKTEDRYTKEKSVVCSLIAVKNYFDTTWEEVWRLGKEKLDSEGRETTRIRRLAPTWRQCGEIYKEIGLRRVFTATPHCRELRNRIDWDEEITETDGEPIPISEAAERFGDCIVIFSTLRHVTCIKDGKVWDEWDSRTTYSNRNSKKEYKVSEVWK